MISSGMAIAFSRKISDFAPLHEKSALRPTGDQYPQWFPVEWGYGLYQ